jgi:hypothetical protein
MFFSLDQGVEVWEAKFGSVQGREGRGYSPIPTLLFEMTQASHV